MKWRKKKERREDGNWRGRGDYEGERRTRGGRNYEKKHEKEERMKSREYGKEKREEKTVIRGHMSST